MAVRAVVLHRAQEITNLFDIRTKYPLDTKEHYLKDHQAVFGLLRHENSTQTTQRAITTVFNFCRLFHAFAHKVNVFT